MVATATYLRETVGALFRSTAAGAKVWRLLARAVRKIRPPPRPGFDPASWEPAPQRGLTDFFFFAVIDWHFRFQRPQHLAMELAKRGHRVFYVSPDTIDDGSPGFRVELLDDVDRLFQVFLHAKGAPAIYFDPPSTGLRAQLAAGLDGLGGWAKTSDATLILQHPFWHGVPVQQNDHLLVYDCLDHHEGFGSFGPEMVELERRLMSDADLLVVSSAWLDAAAGRYNPQCVVIRNAAEYGHFAQRPTSIFRDKKDRRIIGYYGAIAPWLDIELVAAVAERFPEELVLLIGGDQCKAGEWLRGIPNVQMTGEVPYQELPFYLHAFDVCLLPFRVSELTLATNPVKVYEYLSAGKVVVSVDLPEMRQFGDLIRVAGDRLAFLGEIELALSAPAEPEVVERRQAYAAGQTWQHRATQLLDALGAVGR